MIATIFALSLAGSIQSLRDADLKLASSCYQAGFQVGRNRGIVEASDALKVDVPALVESRKTGNQPPPKGCDGTAP